MADLCCGRMRTRWLVPGSRDCRSVRDRIVSDNIPIGWARRSSLRGEVPQSTFGSSCSSWPARSRSGVCRRVCFFPARTSTTWIPDREAVAPPLPPLLRPRSSAPPCMTGQSPPRRWTVSSPPPPETRAKITNTVPPQPDPAVLAATMRHLAVRRVQPDPLLLPGRWSRCRCCRCTTRGLQFVTGRLNAAGSDPEILEFLTAQCDLAPARGPCRRMEGTPRTAWRR